MLFTSTNSTHTCAEESELEDCVTQVEIVGGKMEIVKEVVGIRLADIGPVQVQRKA